MRESQRPHHRWRSRTGSDRIEAPHALVHTGTRVVLVELGANAEAIAPAQIEAIARRLEPMERGSECDFRVLSELMAR